MDNKYFLDNTLIQDFFYDYKVKELTELGKKYYLKDYGINKEKIETIKIQNVIDEISDNGGGVLIVDDNYKTGALYFKDNVNLYIEKDASFIGSNNINDYPLSFTRIEGESGLYYPALLNFIGVCNITISGEGLIDGNGSESWFSFWERRKWNKNAINKDEQRPRIIYVSNSNNITINGLNIKDSHYWNIHIYNSEYIRLMNLNIYSPESPVKAPSTDGIDIDKCRYVLIKGNVFDVNDDAISLKGGKGPYADEDFHNGINEYVIIEDNLFKFCHSCLTLGSESVHNKDIIFRNSRTLNSNNVLWCKMRPDTPQIYENILVDNIIGYSRALLYIYPWTQFFNLKGRKDLGPNLVNNLKINNCRLRCDTYFKVTKSDQYILKNFEFNNLTIDSLISGYNEDLVDGIKSTNITLYERYPNIFELYDMVCKKFKEEHIKSIGPIKEPLIMISNAYPGAWLEHVYDSIMYGNLFDDFSIAKNTINAFLDLQNEKGQIPCFIKADGSIGYSQIQECVSFTKLGLMVYEKTNDLNLLKKLYDKSIKWVDFLYKYRMSLKKGLVECYCGYDTGHDNSGRLDGLKYKGYYSIDGKRIDASVKPDSLSFVSVDMNCNLYMTLKCIKEMAILLNDSNNINKYDKLARTLKKNLFKECFDEEDTFFYDVDINGKRKYLSSTIFHLFQEKVLDKKEDKELIDKLYNKHIKNPEEFWTNYPFPAMALNDKSRLSHKMPNSWGYYSQALIALRCSLWMDYYGYIKDYDYILYQWLDRFIMDFNNNPFGQELDPETGDSSGASLWYSSSLLLFLYAIKRLKLVKSHDIIPKF
ncbi:MAG: hypothetical protein K6E20_04325 [Acholeplasmatales bacterium]|nr:hypothetical protein [Acholeplasmatales bacterium]